MTIEKTELSRRSLVKGAAWSLPVIAVAAATPMAAASVNNATVNFDGTTTNLATIGLLDGSGTLTASVLPTFPNNVVIDNGPGTLDGPLTGVVTITWASGLPVTLLSSGVSRGFGVLDIPGTTLGTRTITENTILDLAPIATLGVYETSQPFTINDASIAGDAQKVLGQIVYGATSRTGVSVDVLMTFTVTVSIYSDGTLVDSPAVATITIPAGAGIL
ncbi:hypothetical protein ACU045_06605 [Microbacterium sp. MAHUQ-60]|uniref:hypothetical protein n=1 Tax=unclassified Microbacterium TaxID=2609290 RepID=UPI0036117F3A